VASYFGSATSYRGDQSHHPSQQRMNRSSGCSCKHLCGQTPAVLYLSKALRLFAPLDLQAFPFNRARLHTFTELHRAPDSPIELYGFHEYRLFSFARPCCSALHPTSTASGRWMSTETS